MPGAARWLSRLPRARLSLLALSLCAPLVTSCTSTPPSESQSQNISVVAPPSLHSEVAAIARSYFRHGYGRVTLETLNGSSVVTRLRSAGPVPDLVFTDGVSVDVHLETPTSHPAVAWFVVFGTSPLVLAYREKEAALIRGASWTSLLKNPSVGYVDPTSDPEGMDAETAVDTAAQTTHDPNILRVLSNPRNVEPSDAIVQRVKVGHTDRSDRV